MKSEHEHEETKDPSPAPAAEDALGTSERERRAERNAPGSGGRPLHREETAPGERGDAPYGDSERGDPRARPGTTPAGP